MIRIGLGSIINLLGFSRDIYGDDRFLSACLHHQIRFLFLLPFFALLFCILTAEYGQYFSAVEGCSYIRGISTHKREGEDYAIIR